MKIYDTFTFFNEIELLDIRLNILNDVVDYFVIAEATKTFQNKEKPLYFKINKNLFSSFSHKIIHIVIEDMPDSDDTRIMESHQRNAIYRGLSECKSNDQILLSDLDEIPNPNEVLNAAKIYGLKMFEQKLYYYYLNKESMELSFLPWSIMFNYSLLTTPQDMREKLKAIQSSYLTNKQAIGVAKLIKNGGWHFSYLGGVDAILNKIKSFADPEYGKPKYRDAGRIRTAIKNGTDLFGRNLSFVTVPIDRNFPDYIRMNKAKFKNLIDENDV